MNRLERISIFTGALDHSVRQGIAELHRLLPNAEILVLLHQPPKPLGRLLRNQWRNLRRNGWRWIPYQMGDLLRAAAGRKSAPPVFAARIPGERYRLERLLAAPKTRLEAVPDINGAAAVAALRAFQPDLGLSIAAPILKPALFDLPTQGTINLHKGKLPDYRGMPPAFWELWQDEQEIGCSVHQVAEKLDAGPLLASTTIQRQPHSTLHGLQLTLDQVGVELTLNALRQLDAGTAEFTPQAPNGKTFRKPTLGQVAALERKLAGALPSGGLRALAKDAAFSTYTKFVAPIPRALRARRRDQRIVVLMYHRVNDELRDAVTVGIEQFDRQMQWLRRRHPLISVRQLVAGDFPTDSRRPLVAVTFDDGYRDNYLNAVPILLRHGVPATFFVSTGLMGTERGFEHDHTKLGRPLANMDWAQLREMTEMGFDVGSHTVSHINCGKNALELVKQELVEAQSTLRQELSIDDVLFAYPFGGRHDIVPEVVAYVREIGYSCCMSAYGGVNTARSLNLFNVLRTGINYNFSRSAFEARLEGLH